MNEILPAYAPSIGQARLIGYFENQSPEWHAVRSQGIGGSEVATILGLSPWESAYTLWAKKTGRIETSSNSTQAMEWGTRLEPAILDKFADEHPDLILRREAGTWQNMDRAWQIVNPDAIYERPDGTKGLVEVKTARYPDAWTDGVPIYYRTQVQWYLQAFGLSHAYVVVLFSGSDYREFEILADEFEQDRNLAAVEEFKTRYLDTDLAPEFSEPMLSTYTTTREMHPEIDPDGEIELGALYEEFLLADAELAEATEEMNRQKATILDLMGNAKRGLYKGAWVVTRQARAGGAPYLVAKR